MNTKNYPESLKKNLNIKLDYNIIFFKNEKLHLFFYLYPSNMLSFVKFILENNFELPKNEDFLKIWNSILNDKYIYINKNILKTIGFESKFDSYLEKENNFIDFLKEEEIEYEHSKENQLMLIVDNFKNVVMVLPTNNQSKEFRKLYSKTNKIYNLYLSYKQEFEINLIKQELEFEKKSSLRLKQISLNKIITKFDFDQWIYIATTDFYSKHNYYKLGGTMSDVNGNNKRLATYNIGRPDEDKYNYVYTRKCNNFKMIEDKIKIYLKDFRPNKKKEMYNIHLDDLKLIVDRFIDNEFHDIEFVNVFTFRAYERTIEHEMDLSKDLFDEDEENIHSDFLKTF